MERRWYYVGLVAVAIAISYFDRQTLPVAIAAIQKNIPLSDQQFSYLGTAFLLTYAAMYDAKVSTGVGILISKDGDFIQIDWALLNVPWEQDPEMDVRLAESNPFREVKEKQINSFLFVAD